MMIKQWIAGMVLWGVISMAAMDDAPLSECSAQLGICYVALMPAEIQDHIASFLVRERETKKEFIERTKNSITISEEYFRLVPSSPQSFADNLYPLKGRRGVRRQMGALNPDQTFFALLKTGEGLVPSLTIIDLQKKEDEKERIHCEQHMSCQNYKTIAISPQAGMIAYTQCSLHGAGVMGERIFRCQVQKINSPDTTIRVFDLPTTFLPARVAFNKQCTRIILHREIISPKERDDSDYILFSVKLREREVTEKKKLPPLQKYLRNRYICASLEGST